MALLGSKPHTAGDTKKWTVSYEDWLENTASISQITVVPDLPSCTIGNIKILGSDIVFFLSGGNVNDQLTLLLTMTDDLGNIKQDTLKFTVVAP